MWSLITKLYPSIDKEKLIEKIKTIMSKRNVEVSLEQAREWYKEGGPLRTIALQAFSKAELLPRPKTWREYIDYKVSSDQNEGFGTKIPLPTKKLAAKTNAYLMLVNVRTAWIQDWNPDWTNKKQKKWCIICNNDNIVIDDYETTLCPLSFPTKEMAEEFLKCFEDLLKDAKGMY